MPPAAAAMPPEKVEPAVPHWTVLASPQPEERFDRIAFPNRNVGYLAGRQQIYKSENGGGQWRPLPGGSRGRVQVLQFQDERTGWLGGDGFFHTLDGGETWQPIALPAPSLMTIRALATSPGSWSLVGGVAGEEDFELFRQGKYGDEWQRIDPQASGLWGGMGEPYRHWYVNDIAIASDHEAVAVLFQGSQEGGVVLRTADGGQTWSRVLTVENDLYHVAFTRSGGGWLTGGDGAVWETADRGGAWKAIISAAIDAPATSGLALSPGGELVIAPLQKGSVLVLRSGKPFETRTDIGLGETLPDAAVVDAGCAYVLGSDGRIARFMLD
jgi:photosystem II stability/assembly factor-like uncharacterized protein